MPDSPAERGVGAVLRIPSLRRYLVGQAISVTGTWMQIVALGWLALEVTGSAVAVGGVTAARTLPILLFSIPAGVLGDRYDRRRIIIGASALGSAAAGALAALSSLGRLDIGALLAFSALAGVAHAFEVPTFNAYLGQLAGRLVVPAIALNGMVFNAARIVGPGIAGVLLATSGGGAVFAINAISYAAFAAILVTLHGGAPTARARRPGGAHEAVSLVRSDPRLAIILSLLAVHTMTMSIPIVLAAPIATDLGADASGAGLLISAAGAGAIVALFVIARGADRPGRRWLLGAGLVGAFGQLALATADGIVIGVVAMAAAGGGMVAYTAISNALIQLIGPDELRARLMSFYGIVIPGIAPLAALVAGASAAVVGLDATLAIAALAWALVLVTAAIGSVGLRALGTTRLASTAPH